MAQTSSLMVGFQQSIMDHKEPSALVLLSGGMDSSVLLYYVGRILGYTNIKTIGFDYGQRHVKELKYAKEIADGFGVDFEELKVDLRQFGSSSLTSSQDVPKAKEDKQYVTVVPSRNAIFLSLASSYATIHNIKDIFIAVNYEDFRTYTDCRRDFIEAISRALSLGGGIQGVYAPFLNWSKEKIVSVGKELGVPLDKTWSCYVGDKTPCGQCDACIERLKAFNKNKL